MLLPFSPPPLPSQAGNTGKYLTTNGAKPSWGSVSSGQKPYTYIVAASGGDYTTLGAALAASSNGDSIYIASSTIEAASVTCALTDLTIICSNPTAVQVGMGSYTLTLSGTGLLLKNVGVSLSTGQVLLSGANALATGCVFSVSGVGPAGGSVHVSGNYSTLQGCQYISSNTTARTYPEIELSGIGNTINGCYILCSASTSDTTTVQASVYMAGTGGVLSNSTLVSNANNTHLAIGLVSADQTVSDNFIYTTDVFIYAAGNGFHNISNNNLQNNYNDYSTYSIYLNAPRCVVSGNIIQPSLNAPAYAIYDSQLASQQIISNNSIYLGSTSTGLVAIYTYYGNGIITNNFIYKGAIGVEIASTSTGAFVGSNVTSSTTTPLSNSSTSTVFGIDSSSAQILTNKSIIKRVTALTVSGSTYTPDVDTTDIATISSPTAAFTIANPTGTFNDGQQLTVRILSGTTAYGITWGTEYISSGIATLPTTGVASKTITMGFQYDATKAALVLLAVDNTGY